MKTANDEREVITQYERMVQHRARLLSAWAGGSYDKEDLVQIGRVALLVAWRGWQRIVPERRTASFFAYAKKRVWWTMFDFVARERYRAKAIEEAGPLADTTYKPAWIPSPEEAASVFEQCERLSERESRVLAAHLEGHSLEDIASLEGTSKPTAHRVLASATRTLGAE